MVSDHPVFLSTLHQLNAGLSVRHCGGYSIGRRYCCLFGPPNMDPWKFQELANESGDQFKITIDGRLVDTPKSNAIRHATVAALIAFNNGAEFAKMATDIHEFYAPGPALDTLVDLHNNAYGISLGEALRNVEGVTNETIVGLIRESYDFGVYQCVYDGVVSSC